MRLIVLVAASLLLIAPLASGAVYMKIADIKGESQDRAAGGGNNTIDVLAWSWGMSRSPTGVITQEPVVVHVNSSHGEFWFTDLVPGEYALGSMRLGVDGGSTELVLQDASVRTYRIEAEGNEVREEVAFYYNKISMESTPADGSEARTLTIAGQA